MRIFIIYTKAGPFRAYLDQKEAYSEYNRLKNLDDLVDYSLIALPVKTSYKPQKNDG